MIKVDFEDVSFMKGDEDTILAELAFALEMVRTSLVHKYDTEYAEKILNEVIELSKENSDEIDENNTTMRERNVSGKDSN